MADARLQPNVLASEAARCACHRPNYMYVQNGDKQAP